MFFYQTALTNLVSLICYQVIWSGNKVIDSDKDADMDIAWCTLHVAETGRRVNVVAGDTDVALLLL